MSTEEDKKAAATEENMEEEDDDDDLEKLQAEIDRMEAEAARISKETEELEKKKQKAEDKKDGSGAAAAAASDGDKVTHDKYVICSELLMIDERKGPTWLNQHTHVSSLFYSRHSIYVGQVDYSTTPEELLAHFEACGTVERVTIVCDKFTGKPKGIVSISWTGLLRYPTFSSIFCALFTF